MPEQELFDAILAGRSMFISSKQHRIICSSIVGGILPIACGVALGIRLNGGNERAYVFCGDMTSRCGIFHEFKDFCRGHSLPVRITIEDNSLSTNSPTEEAWGTGTIEPPVTRYEYLRNWPHVGIGHNVSF